MLERDAVTQAVTELFHGALSGRGGSLFVVGEAGLGKTTVLELACGLARGTRIGLARGDVMEAGLPFALVAQLVDSLGGDDAIAVPLNFASADDARASRYHRTLCWLKALTHDGPVVLAVDDLHWSDGDSLALLSYLCRRIASLPVTVVATLRPWPPAAEGVCLGLVIAGHARLERLRPLSETAARAVLAGQLGRAVDGEVGEQAVAASAGNPLLLEQVALAIRRGSPPDRAGDPPLLEHFAGLSATGLRFARAASVVGRRFDPGVAVMLAGLEVQEAVPALDSLSTSGLVREFGAGGAEFTHPWFRQALYDELPPMVRKELHGRVFRLLVDRGRETEAAEHAVLGDLSGDAEAVAVLTSAGRSALRVGGVATAVRRLEAAVRLAGSQATPDVVLLLGEAKLAGGDAADAVLLLEALIERPGLPVDTRVEGLRMLGRSLVVAGEATRGMQGLEDAAAAAGAGEPAGAVRAMLDLSRAAWLTGGPASALPPMDRARHMVQRLDEGLRMEVDAAWGFVAFVGGDPAGLVAASDAGRWAEAHDATVARDLWWNWGTRRNYGRAAKYAERFDESASVFEAMFAQAEQAGSPQAIVSLAAHHADTLVRRARLGEALHLADRAMALAELAPMARAFAYAVKALVLLHLDRVQESQTYCRRAEDAASIRGQWLPLLRAMHLRALMCLHGGDVGGAHRLHAQLADQTTRLGIGEPCLVPWGRQAVIAHLRVGHIDAAERVVAWLDGCAARMPCRWPRIAAASSRASLAEERGDGDGAETELRCALALHEQVDLPIERVETLLQLGAFLRRSGRLQEARDVLREASAMADHAGARWLARLVHAELVVAGGRRRRRDAPAQTLTAQEERVAGLAAAGRSASEIARELSLSRRTIETHLGRIYAKLGVHSQRELMARHIETVGEGGTG